MAQLTNLSDIINSDQDQLQAHLAAVNEDARITLLPENVAKRAKEAEEEAAIEKARHDRMIAEFDAAPYQYVNKWPDGTTTITTENETPSQRRKHLAEQKDREKTQAEIKAKQAFIPSTPTKIDVKSGVGVPGGFSADTYKIDPSKMTSTAKASFVRIKPPALPSIPTIPSVPSLPGVPTIPTIPTINPRVMPKIRNMAGDASAAMAKNLSAADLTAAQDSVKASIPSSELASIIKQQENEEAAVAKAAAEAKAAAVAATAKAAATYAAVLAAAAKPPTVVGILGKISGVSFLKKLFR